jgi:hypothetical protein
MLRDYWRAWRQKSAATPERLKEALQWVGIERGRAATYERLLVEYSQGQRSNEHFFAYYEAMEVVNIFESWRDKSIDFPGIQDKISFVFKKGTVLSENESASANSNRPRNDAFVYVLAGKLLHVGEAHIISVDSIQNRTVKLVHTEQESPADIVLLFRENLIMVECKRPMSSATLDDNAEQAFRQLTDRSSSQTWGIIAIDASRIVRKPGEYLEASSLQAGTEFLTNELAKLLVPTAKRYNHESILGLIGFSRVPLVGTAKSRILKYDETPFIVENLSSAAIAYLSIKNAKSPQGDLMHELQRSFSQTTHDIPRDAVPIT